MNWKRPFCLMIAVLFSRTLIIALLNQFTGGSEFSDDVYYHRLLIADPFQILRGQIEVHVGSYAPFIGMLEAIIFELFPKSWPEFWKFRLNSVFFEATSAFFLGLTFENIPLLRKKFSFLVSILLLVPSGWICSAVMAQDESIGALFLAVVIWLVSLQRYRLAIFLCSLGVLAAKIFLILPLIVLLFLNTRKSPQERLQNLLCGLGPIIMIYSWILIQSFKAKSGIPLAQFAPEGKFGAHYWAWILSSVPEGGSVLWARNFSLLLACVPLLGLFLFKSVLDAERFLKKFSLMSVAALLWFFSFFYLMNPEYTILVLGLVCIAAQDLKAVALSSTFLSFSWVVNFFYGLGHFRKVIPTAGGLSDSGKNAFLEFYLRLFSVQPHFLHQVCLFLNSALLFGLAIYFTQVFVQEFVPKSKRRQLNENITQTR